MLSRHLSKYDAVVRGSLRSTALRGYATAMEQTQVIINDYQFL